MIKYITFLLTLSLMSAFVVFMNCTPKGPQGQGGVTPGGTDSSVEGFFPGQGGGQGSGSQSNNRFYMDSEGYTSSSGYRSSAGGSNNNDPYYKNSYVKENEERWGTSAPIGSPLITLDEVDQDVFTDFRLGEEINTMRDIKDLRVYVKLKKASGGGYAGQVTISYYDNGIGKMGGVRLNSGTGSDSKYNVWLKAGAGKSRQVYGFHGFHGFFQERDSSLILVIDKETNPRNPDGGDDTTKQLVGGSLWIMTFKEIFPARQTKGNSCAKRDGAYIRDYNQSGKGTLTQKSRKCWFIDNGPFDCRAWRKGSGVDTLKQLLPDNDCYTKLGDFSGLDVLKAFGVKRTSDL